MCVYGEKDIQIRRLDLIENCFFAVTVWSSDISVDGRLLDVCILYLCKYACVGCKGVKKYWKFKWHWCTLTGWFYPFSKVSVSSFSNLNTTSSLSFFYYLFHFLHMIYYSVNLIGCLYIFYRYFCVYFIVSYIDFIMN